MTFIPPDPAITDWVPIWNPMGAGPPGPSGATAPHHLTHEHGGTDEVLFPSGLFERGRPLAAGEWGDYGPLLTAVTTPPTLGTSALVGRYSVVGKTVTAVILLITDASFNPGVGAWGFSLPLLPAGIFLNGTVWIYEAGTTWAGSLGAGGFVFGGNLADKVFAMINTGGNAPILSSTVPFNWTGVAANVFIQCTYETA